MPERMSSNNWWFFRMEFLLNLACYKSELTLVGADISVWLAEWQAMVLLQLILVGILWKSNSYNNYKPAGWIRWNLMVITFSKIGRWEIFVSWFPLPIFAVVSSIKLYFGWGTFSSPPDFCCSEGDSRDNCPNEFLRMLHQETINKYNVSSINY